MSDAAAASLDLELGSGPIERAAVQVAAVSFFSDDRPLRGDAGRADWRLCGRLSSLLQEGRIADDGALLATTEGRMRAPLVLGFPLGESALWSYARARRAAADLVGRLIDLGVRSAALSPLGVWQGALSPTQSAEALLEGAVTALAAHPATLHLALADVPADITRSTSFHAAASEAPSQGVQVQLRATAASPPQASAQHP